MTVLDEINSYGYYVIKCNNWFEANNGIHKYRASNLELLLKVLKLPTDNKHLYE